MSSNRLTGTIAVLLVLLGATACSTEYQVGAVISETGPAEVYGAKVKKGLDLALEEINAAGGVAGKTFTLVYRDDMSKADVGREAATELIDEVGVHSIIGAVTSAVTLEIAPICEKKRTLLLSPTASAPAITDAGFYIFRNYPSDILEGTSMADFGRDLGLSTVVIFAVDEAFGSGLTEVFRRKYENRFREVLKVFKFEDGKPETYGSMVAETKELDPDGIYLVGYVTAISELLTRIHAAEIDAVLMGSGSVTEDVVAISGAAAEHLVYPQPPFDVDSEEAEVRAFVEAYRARYNNEEPDTFAAHGYDALKILALAMETGGAGTADGLRAGLSQIDSYKGASGTAGFDANGDVVQYPRLFIIHQGQAMPYERFLAEGNSLAIRGRN